MINIAISLYDELVVSVKNYNMPRTTRILYKIDMLNLDTKLDIYNLLSESTSRIERLLNSMTKDSSMRSNYEERIKIYKRCMNLMYSRFDSETKLLLEVQ